ncbi:hypothetical protein QQP08_013845 [Theobroma cacao]|nr:hypothetical protein QQP08_013845 [Theobroma cacao]
MLKRFKTNQILIKLDWVSSFISLNSVPKPKFAAGFSFEYQKCAVFNNPMVSGMSSVIPGQFSKISPLWPDLDGICFLSDMHFSPSFSEVYVAVRYEDLHVNLHIADDPFCSILFAIICREGAWPQAHLNYHPAIRVYVAFKDKIKGTLEVVFW